MDKICPKCQCNITVLEEIEMEAQRRSSLNQRLKLIENDRLSAIKKLDKKNKER